MHNLKEEIKKLRSALNDLSQRIRSGRDENIMEDFSEASDRIDRLQEVEENKGTMDVVRTSREFSRPTTLDYIDMILDDFIEMHGDRRFADDKAIVGGIGWLNRLPVTFIGHQKGRDVKENIERNFGMAHPEGYRKAWRLMKEAERFHRPVINLIDTPGAYPGIGAEERGQAEAIAFNLYEMSGLKVPIISVITGEGGSGGALALGVADRVFMLENSIYSVISPEGCAAILWKDASKSAAAAEAMKITSQDLFGMGIVDGIIPEPGGGAHLDPAKTAANLKSKLLEAVEELLGISNPRQLVENRYLKYRKMGHFLE